MTTNKKPVRKSAKPPVFRVRTNHQFGGEDVFDTDLTGLHKLVRPVEIRGKKVRYLPPSISQVPYMMNFIIEAFSDLIMSEEELRKLDRNELFLRVVDFVVSISQDINSGDQSKANEGEQILGSAFGSKAALTFLLPAMSECFPDLVMPNLTNEAFLDCFNLLFSDMFIDK